MMNSFYGPTGRGRKGVHWSLKILASHIFS
jgi:hypothetical protein